jgi:hypothetical protein
VLVVLQALTHLLVVVNLHMEKLLQQVVAKVVILEKLQAYLLVEHLVLLVQAVAVVLIPQVAQVVLIL